MIAIIGGGFIGSHIAAHLKHHYPVQVFDTNPERGIPCDITKSKTLANNAQLCSADVIINAAIIQIPQIQRIPQYGFGVNVLGTINLCNLLHTHPPIKGFIQFGTWHVDAEAITEREQLYVQSKRAQEAIVAYYEMMTRKPCVTLRLGTVLGRGMSKDTVVRTFIRQARQDSALTPYEDVCQLERFYVMVEDVCRFTEMVIQRLLAGDDLQTSYNVFYPHPLTLVDLAHAVAQHASASMRPPITIIQNPNAPAEPPSPSKITLRFSDPLDAIRSIMDTPK